jgi:dTDP-4-dehydrorhamnose reductase
VRIAVLGAGGQLGAAIVREYSTAGTHDVVPLVHAALDVTDDAAVAAAVEPIAADVIINCVAFNDVDAAEDRPVEALQVNAFAVRTLARLAERSGATFVHYGTDFVFDGTSTRPYTEEDRPSPRSTYGASKMLGEWFALDAPRGYVLRVESLFGQVPGGPRPRGSVATIVNALLDGSSPRVFEDRTVSPTYLPDAARATRLLLEAGAPFGLYHCVNTGMCTWLSFATEVAGRLGLEPRLTPVRMAEVTLRAQRPQFCALSNEKLRQVGVEMPSWQDAVDRFAFAARTSAAADPP